MTRARPCLAGAAALVLAFAVSFAPAPAADPPPVDKTPKRNPDSPYAHTAIGAVIDANDGKVPASGFELTAALDKLGDFVQLPVAFSAVALDSGLTHPRVIIAMRPEPPRALFQTGQGGWGGWGGGLGGFDVSTLNSTAASRPQLEGRLFFAANTELRPDGLHARTVEFISWNGRRQAFDFGFIDMTDRTELRVFDGTRCFSCHKNRGPILGVAPWSNTAHNRAVYDAAINALDAFQQHRYADGLGPFVNYVEVDTAAIDAAVRRGADLLRDRALFKELAAATYGPKVLALLIDAIVAPGSLRNHDVRLKKELDAIPLGEFLGDARLVRQATPPSELRDFGVAGLLRREMGTRRELSADHVPSNPKAFVRPPTKVIRKPSEVLSAERLARTIGLSEPDRQFLLGLFPSELQSEGSALAPIRLAAVTQILASPQFADLMTKGILPDRDDFKDRYVAGMVAVRLNAGEFPVILVPDRATYTSAPKLDPRAKPSTDVPVLPSHACLGCHDTAAGKKGFNPIPALAFDPFDATARADWLKFTDRARKGDVLTRMLKRIDTDKDMPPTDSVEHELYRTKDPTALAAVKGWLEAELKKVR